MGWGSEGCSYSARQVAPQGYLIELFYIVCWVFNPFVVWGHPDPLYAERGYTQSLLAVAHRAVGLGAWRREKQQFQWSCALGLQEPLATHRSQIPAPPPSSPFSRKCENTVETRGYFTFGCPPTSNRHLDTQDGVLSPPPPDQSIKGPVTRN